MECSVHGNQDKTYVCRHLLHSLRDGRIRGFWFGASEDTERPDAWCDECNEHLIAGGGSWTEEIQAKCSIALLCGMCYDNVKALNDTR